MVVAFGLLLAAAVGLRLFAVLTFRPAVLDLRDSAAYIRAAHSGLSLDTLDPSGYPLFLRLAHALSSELVVTVVLQHAMGLAAGVLVFLAVRRLGAPPFLSLVPAAVVWLNGDQLFLEHNLLTESLFTFLLSAMLYAAVRCLDDSPSVAWPLLTGGLAGGLLAVRSVALVLGALVIVWLALALWRTDRRWVRPTLVAAASALLVVCGYSTLRHEATGRWSPFADGSGWILYSRVAQFANCDEFEPPRGTRMLCEDSRPASRPGQLYYEWLGGPARRAFGDPPGHDRTLRAFARAAIFNQPLDYLYTVGDDLRRFIDPTAHVERYGGGADADAITFLRSRPRPDAEIVREARAYYAPFEVRVGGGAQALSDYQRIVRVHGPIVLAFLLVALAGACVAEPRIRWALALLVAVSVYLMVFPVATTLYEWRFGIPGQGAIAAGAVLGAWSLTAWVRRRRRSISPAIAEATR